ncbi:hypothetical protein [Paraburkholderia sp.]|uniref:hypothetical protein n=1 Tax=Paraburkholderia sp. TaxID=1926495 RepID=UPI002F3E4BB9
MTKPSERIVVFVTTAQKRAITATAGDLGISVSELMRRAVLSFGATSEQVKAASIVDRLRAPRAPDALNIALQRVAHGTRDARAALPGTLQARDKDAAGATVDRSAPSGATGIEAAGARSVSNVASGGAAEAVSETGVAAEAVSVAIRVAAEPAPLLPAGVAAALAAEHDADAQATAEAVARVTAARVAQADDPAQQLQPQLAGTPARPRNSLKRRRVPNLSDVDEPGNDPSTEGGRFA